MWPCVLRVSKKGNMRRWRRQGFAFGNGSLVVFHRPTSCACFSFCYKIQKSSQVTEALLPRTMKAKRSVTRRNRQTRTPPVSREPMVKSWKGSSAFTHRRWVRVCVARPKFLSVLLHACFFLTSISLAQLFLAFSCKFPDTLFQENASRRVVLKRKV